MPANLDSLAGAERSIVCAPTGSRRVIEKKRTTREIEFEHNDDRSIVSVFNDAVSAIEQDKYCAVVHSKSCLKSTDVQVDPRIYWVVKRVSQVDVL